MKTIKFIFVVLSAFISINTIGQSVLVKGGVSFAQISHSASFETTHQGKIKTGYHLGAGYEKSLSDVLFLDLEPMLHLKGDDVNINLLYLEVPILIKAYLELSDDILIYNTLGPYLGLGLLGRGYKNRTISWGEDYTRFDFGFSVGAGFDFRGKQIGLAYDFSLLNNEPDTRGSRFGKHRVLRLSLSYNLGNKSVK